jgi:peptidoglycan/xylan/chitin deacetylase (PgdA/CDA1 family)
MSRRLCSVSVDLDPLRCYHQIHGLDGPDDALLDVVLRRALPRFLELFARHGISATLFVVGSDIAEGASATARTLLKQAAAAGHELGNHSFRHPYDLARRSRAELEREIGDCHHALRALSGRAPTGFRAPGYELSADLIDILEAFGYRYDSSLFPCPPYYLLKLAVLGKMALFRQRSASIIGAPRAQLGPTQPYRPDAQRPWQHGQSLLVELPIAVTPYLRLPAFGSSLLLFDRLRPLLLRGMASQRFFNFELHGMDLLGAEEDGLPATLQARQPDLRVPLKRRLAALDEVLAAMRKDADVMTLHSVAEKVQRHGHLDP